MSTIINSQFNEIVFQNRNKLFGSYIIRKNYSSDVIRAVAFSIVFFSLALLSPIIYNYFTPTKMGESIDVQEVTLLEQPPSIDPNELPPPPAPRVELPKISTIKFIPPVVKEDKEVIEKEEVPDQTKMENSIISNTTQEGDNAKGLNELILNSGNGNGSGIVEHKEEVLTYVGQMPEFTGGHTKMEEFFQKHIKYPESAKENNIVGKVWISFIVHKNGSLSDFKVIKSLSHGCDEEALRVAKMMPHWQPGKENGVPKDVLRKCPISFTLEN